MRQHKVFQAAVVNAEVLLGRVVSLWLTQKLAQPSSSSIATQEDKTSSFNSNTDPKTSCRKETWRTPGTMSSNIAAASEDALSNAEFMEGVGDAGGARRTSQSQPSERPV